MDMLGGGGEGYDEDDYMYQEYLDEKEIIDDQNEFIFSNWVAENSPDCPHFGNFIWCPTRGAMVWDHNGECYVPVSIGATPWPYPNVPSPKLQSTFFEKSSTIDELASEILTPVETFSPVETVPVSSLSLTLELEDDLSDTDDSYTPVSSCDSPKTPLWKTCQSQASASEWGEQDHPSSPVTPPSVSPSLDSEDFPSLQPVFPRQECHHPLSIHSSAWRKPATLASVVRGIKGLKQCQAPEQKVLPEKYTKVIATCKYVAQNLQRPEEHLSYEVVIDGEGYSAYVPSKYLRGMKLEIGTKVVIDAVLAKDKKYPYRATFVKIKGNTHSFRFHYPEANKRFGFIIGGGGCGVKQIIALAKIHDQDSPRIKIFDDGEDCVVEITGQCDMVVVKREIAYCLSREVEFTDC
jgi:hypothetical protein